MAARGLPVRGALPPARREEGVVARHVFTAAWAGQPAGMRGRGVRPTRSR